MNELENSKNNYEILDLSSIGRNSNTIVEVYTNIEDSNKIFNLENHIDYKLNDCENVVINVKDILIKRYEKPLKKPIIDSETGEILQDREYKMTCTIVDPQGFSYVTGSKIFTIQMMRYLQMKTRIGDKKENFRIKIIKNKLDNGNKSLGFLLEE